MKNNRCNLIMNCPKFRLSDLFCFDYMEIQDYYGWDRRHCGIQRPVNLSLGRFTSIMFISSGSFKFPLTGFRCRIQCELNDKNQKTTTTASPQRLQPSNCTCGVSQNRRKSKIINGTLATTAEFPWAVALVGNEDETPFCGGSLISSRYILTAAHCVQGSHSRFRVMLNYDPETVVSYGTTRTLRLAVDHVIVHPKYNSLRLDFDAALIKLTFPFELNDSTYTVPVCLPELRDRNRNFAHENATVIGWGATELDGKGPKVPIPLQKVGLSIMPDRKCQDAYRDRRIKPEKLCAYSPFQDSCEGDSGGPLMFQTRLREGTRALIQIGIVSSGSGCAQVDSPGIYIRTSEILTWITINTKDSSYCTYR